MLLGLKRKSELDVTLHNTGAVLNGGMIIIS